MTGQVSFLRAVSSCCVLIIIDILLMAQDRDLNEMGVLKRKISSSGICLGLLFKDLLML